MANLPDLTSAMKSFEKALVTGEIAVQACALDSKLFLHLDKPNGESRLTYVRLDEKTVTALAMFIKCDPVEGQPCFNVGWAVPEKFQGKSRAAEVFKAAVNELRYGLARNGVTTFYVEAVVAADNKASQRIAEKVISTAGKVDTDAYSGVPVIQYLRKIDAGTVL